MGAIITLLVVCIGVPVLAGAIVLYLVHLIPKKWEGTPAAEFEQLKCTTCRGGVQAIFTSSKGAKHHGFARIPDDLLLLHRRPDSKGGDKWGSPMANLRDCPCCQGKGFHLVARDQPSSWLACARPEWEDRPADASGGMQ
jgi:hypothetical protein